jgi:hypothetical protein
VPVLIRQIRRKITVKWIVPLIVPQNVCLPKVMQKSFFDVICPDENRLGRSPCSGGMKSISGL